MMCNNKSFKNKNETNIRIFIYFSRLFKKNTENLQKMYTSKNTN